MGGSCKFLFPWWQEGNRELLIKGATMSWGQGGGVWKVKPCTSIDMDQSIYVIPCLRRKVRSDGGGAFPRWIASVSVEQHLRPRYV